MYVLDYEILLICSQLVDFYVFFNELYQKFQFCYKLVVYNCNFDWFCFWLQGYEDMDLVKVEQYDYWCVMWECMKLYVFCQC